MSEKYILYARKSTDVEDKQVLSIEAQLVELRAYAKNENLTIIDELVEKQSAKTPGRPVFGDMLKRIENGEASGIIAWHPDRLARNSIDGGQVVYLLDRVSLIFVEFRVTSLKVHTSMISDEQPKVSRRHIVAPQMQR